MSVRDLGSIDRAVVGPTVDAWLDVLDGPTLFRIAGRDRSRTRIVSTLLHGNEPSGLRALHAILRDGAVRPAVDILCFIGAPEAARFAPRFSRRFLEGHRDLNRCFVPPWTGADGAIARDALALLRAAGAEAHVDVHNNTGHNPAYGVGMRADKPQIGLASLFADRYVHSRLRLGSIVEVLGEELPSVTIECGRAGDPAADRCARAGLERYMQVSELPYDGADRVRLLVDAVRVTARAGVRIAFGAAPDRAADLTLTADIDRHNFSRVEAGTSIGWVGRDVAWPIEAIDEKGRDLSHAWFERNGDELVTTEALVPIMMTTHPEIARSDCLFYVVRYA